MGLFSFIKNKIISPVDNKDDAINNAGFQEGYGKRQMRERADAYVHSEPPNALKYMSDGSGYLYVTSLVYICRADQKMNADARNIIIEFIRKYSQDTETPSESIENQIRRWITPSRMQFAVNIKDIVEDKNILVLKDIYNYAVRIVATFKNSSDLQKKAIEKIKEAINALDH